MVQCTLVHGAIKERRDHVNDENRDVRAVGDEQWIFQFFIDIYIYIYIYIYMYIMYVCMYIKL